MAHNPVNHPLRPIYRVVGFITGGYLVAFGILGLIQTAGEPFANETGIRVLAVNPGPVPTEWQQTAGYAPDRAAVVPGQIPADQVVSESLAAYDRGRRSMIPGRTIRWFIRATRPSPRGIQLRVAERLYRPR